MRPNFVKATVALVLLIGSTLPFATNAAPTTDTSLVPATEQLDSEGRWVCKNDPIPFGWVKTQAGYVCPAGIGRKAIGYYIEPFNPNRSSYWVCPSSWKPEGWVTTEQDTMNTPCHPFNAYYLEPFDANKRGQWICSGSWIPYGWITTGARHHSSCPVTRQLYIEPFN